MGTDKEIIWINIKNLYSLNYEKGGGFDLRVGCWQVDGRKGEPVLEKRDWWESKDGQKMAGKPKGLTKNDLFRIFDAASELSKLMGFPLPAGFAGVNNSQPVENDAINEPVNQPPSGRF